MNKLLVFQLTIQSSYSADVEREAEADCFDTLQWWFSETEAWRIKTFAIDQDIHTYLIAGPLAEETAIENTMKHYGDVVAKSFVLEFEDPRDPDEVAKVMENVGGAAALEFAKNGRPFAFWNPTQAKFKSTSTPQHG